MSTNENLAAVVVEKDNPLKQMLLEYVGNKYQHHQTKVSLKSQYR